MAHLSQLTIGRPRTKIGLALHPLYSHDEYVGDITADTSQLSVSEMEVPTVRQLLVTNRGGRTVLLTAGSVLKGGRQNRVVEQSVLIRPFTAVEVRTACIEQGRWSGAREFTGVVGWVSSLVFTPLESSLDRSRSAERPAVARADQGAVWEAVAERLAARGVVSGSSDYLSAAGTAPLGPADRERIRRVIADGPRRGQVGVAVSNADGILAADVFGSPDLLRDNWERLVTAYFEDADPKRPTTGSADAVLDLLSRAEKFGTTAVWSDELSTVERFDHRSVTGSMLTDGGRLVHARVVPVR